jgi:hypothetical protein
MQLFPFQNHFSHNTNPQHGVENQSRIDYNIQGVAKQPTNAEKMPVVRHRARKTWIIKQSTEKNMYEGGTYANTDAQSG